MTSLSRLLVCTILLFTSGCTGSIKNTESLQAFIEHMSVTHQFDRSELSDLFEAVEIKDDILKKISTPAEGLPWYKYRKIFMTDARIDGGVKFWQENEQALSAVQQQYGVPAEIITAIIGVETAYGQNTGKYRVIDALSTLAFAYPPRSKFFLKELEDFLLLCKEGQINPLEPTGSYAGAMGMPQFMPSSYRAYAVDFDNNGRPDIWHSNSDVIASVGNYFVRHGWHKEQLIAEPITNNKEKGGITDSLKPNLRIAQLQSFAETISKLLPSETKVKLLSFKQEHAEELWATLENFYVITRYNHSPLYAMAVYQLSQAISSKKHASAYE